MHYLSFKCIHPKLFKKLDYLLFYNNISSGIKLNQLISELLLLLNE
jgi:hypothetical protein